MMHDTKAKSKFKPETKEQQEIYRAYINGIAHVKHATVASQYTDPLLKIAFEEGIKEGNRRKKESVENGWFEMINGNRRSAQINPCSEIILPLSTKYNYKPFNSN